MDKGKLVYSTSPNPLTKDETIFIYLIIGLVCFVFIFLGNFWYYFMVSVIRSQSFSCVLIGSLGTLILTFFFLSLLRATYEGFAGKFKIYENGMVIGKSLSYLFRKDDLFIPYSNIKCIYLNIKKKPTKHSSSVVITIELTDGKYIDFNKRMVPNLEEVKKILSSRSIEIID